MNDNPAETSGEQDVLYAKGTSGSEQGSTNSTVSALIGLPPEFNPHCFKELGLIRAAK